MFKCDYRCEKETTFKWCAWRLTIVCYCPLKEVGGASGFCYQGATCAAYLIVFYITLSHLYQANSHMFAYLMEYFLRNGLYVQKWKKNPEMSRCKTQLWCEVTKRKLNALHSTSVSDTKLHVLTVQWSHMLNDLWPDLSKAFNRTFI